MTTKKRGLGRGLDALIEQSGVSGGSPSEVALTQLRPNPHQPRTDFDEEGLAALADSIRAQGLLQPILVTPDDDGTFVILAGERRFRAARLAGLEQVPVVVRPEVSERERLELALVENLQRADLNAIEEAEAYDTLHQKFGLSHEEVAARVGKSRVAVTNGLRLLRLPEAVRQLVRKGELTAGQARPLLSLKEPQQQIDLAQRAVRQHLSARAIEQLVSAPAAPAVRAQKPADVNTVAAAEALTRGLQTRVEIRRSGKGGQVRIHFHSEPELMRLYDRLLGREENEP
jgi:ParB family transcriptional regulator, chromosome partitioning protein